MLLDTHVLVWAMLAPNLLSDLAREALARATERCVSAANLYEITYKAMLGKWPEVEGLLSVDLDARLRSDGFEVIPASGRSWSGPDASTGATGIRSIGSSSRRRWSARCRWCQRMERWTTCRTRSFIGSGRDVVQDHEI